MAGSTFGKLFTITTFGESHGVAVGAVIDGCPAQIPLSEEDIQTDLNRRRPGQSEVSTPRDEKDRVQIVSGVFEGVTTGAPICAFVRNKSFDSSKYIPFKDKFRPGHADFTFWKKYGFRDWRGSGRASGRETVGRVIGGAIAKKVLAKDFINIIGHTIQIGKIKAKSFEVTEIERNDVRCADPKAAIKMKQLVVSLKAQGDSIGGVAEIRVVGVPPGLGSPVFEKLQAELGKALFSIGTVKGLEFGDGFASVTRQGSENNDEFAMKDGRIGTKTNAAGGVLGGISTGEPLMIRIASKPPSSIVKKQDTVNKEGNPETIEVHGHHDPVVVPRLIPVAESMVALVLVDQVLQWKAYKEYHQVF